MPGRVFADILPGGFSLEGGWTERGRGLRQVAGGRKTLGPGGLGPGFCPRPSLAGMVTDCPGLPGIVLALAPKVPHTQKILTPRPPGMMVDHPALWGPGTSLFGLEAQLGHHPVRSAPLHPSFAKGLGRQGRGTTEQLRKARRALCLGRPLGQTHLGGCRTVLPLCADRELRGRTWAWAASARVGPIPLRGFGPLL